jgi:hypothetical protein
MIGITSPAFSYSWYIPMHRGYESFFIFHLPVFFKITAIFLYYFLQTIRYTISKYYINRKEYNCIIYKEYLI